MSTSMAVGAVSAVLRGLVQQSVSEHNLAAVLGADPEVTVLPPDRITSGAGTPNRINLFLFQATENAAWRNLDFPSRNGSGERLTNPKLALDLHYLVTAHAGAELQAEALLGHAMFVFHETPVVTRKAIQDSLNLLPIGNPFFDALRNARLRDQFEQIRIVPRVLNVEEVSKIWTALQSQYRTTAAYQVTVVLIEAEKPARSALPVLSRGRFLPSGGDEGVFVQAGLQPPVPTIESLKLPTERQPALRLGETLSLHGHHLASTSTPPMPPPPLPQVRFRLLRGGDMWLLDAAAGANDEGMTVQMPPDPPAAPVPATSPLNPDNWRAGTYEVTALITKGDSIRETNAFSVVLAPRVVPPVNVGGVPPAIQVTCSPPVQPGQIAVLIVGTRELRAEPFIVATKNLSFPLPADEPLLTGTHPLRLRVDGIDSLVVDYTAQPPQFDASQTVVVP
jgi:hypothetical protein